MVEAALVLVSLLALSGGAWAWTALAPDALLFAGFWAVAVYSVIFAVGLTGVAAASIHQAWRTDRTRRRAGAASVPAEPVLGSVGD